MKTKSIIMVFLVAILLASCAPIVEATPNPVRPGDTVGDMVVLRKPSKHFFWLMSACPFDWTILEPHSQTVECTLSELAAVGIGDYWAAEETKIDSNWQAMSWELSVDGQQVALDDFGWEEIHMVDSGMNIVARHWNVILRPLSPGIHTVRTSWTNSEPIDDGYDIYPPGKHEYVANLTVTAKPDYPSVSTEAIPGQNAYSSEVANLDFLLYIPEAYGSMPGTKWPMIVYLHDAELRGTSPELIAGDSLPKQLATKNDFPFLVLSPVGDGDFEFWSSDAMSDSLLALIDEVISKYSIDTSRVYLTGAGMGGNGVWAIGLNHPGYFAALAPLGGYLGHPFQTPDNICDLTPVPVWAFHGGNDFMVPVEVEQELVDALNECGGDARISVIPQAVIPLQTYSDSALYEWLISNSKD